MMRKILLIVVAITLLTKTSEAQKAFEKGNIVIDFGIGFGGYGTKSHEEKDVKIWNGSGIVTVRTVKDTTDGAAATIIPLGFEYGINNWLGIGAQFGYSKYIVAADSSNNNVRPTVKAIDAGLIVNVHLIKTSRFDMPFSFTFGYSNFNYNSNDLFGSKAKDNGLNYGIALVPRIYFGNHIGLFFNLGYKGYNYPSLLFSNDKDSNLNNDNNQLVKFKFNGVNIGVGLVVKL